jgi:hypothetical protein
MIYSRWRPATGGYDYYETSEQVPLANDLPIPRLNVTSPIGVASTEAGRQIPSGAKHVGSGPFAKGLIAPLDRSRLGVVSSIEDVFSRPILLFSVGVLVGWLWSRYRK